MAAIDLTRLGQQTEALIASYDEPQLFLARLHSLLRFYHRYSHRTQKSALPSSFLPSYDLPQQILPEVEARLAPIARAKPKETLALADFIWQDGNFEPKVLGAYILGQLGVEWSQQTLERLTQWFSTTTDRAATEALLQLGSQTVCRAAPDLWKEWIAGNLRSSIKAQCQAGLRALALWLPEAPSQFLPAILDWVRPFLFQPDTGLENELEAVFAALAIRTPQESAYLLKEALAESHDSLLPARIRRYRVYFPAELANSLTQAVRTHQDAR